MKKIASLVAVLVLTAACAHSQQQPPNAAVGKDSVAPKEAAAKGTVTKNAAGTEKATDASQSEFKTLEDRWSYAYGLDLAHKFKSEDIKFNFRLMAEAMQAVFEGGKERMTADEAIATLQIFKEVYLKEKAEKRAVAGEKNKKEGEAFLKENAKKEGVVVTKSGLQYKVITQGNGRYKPKEDEDVKIHYRATFVDGTEFDNTYKRNKPYTGMPRQLIQGVTEALQLMTEGSKWELYIPADLAYGEKGSDPWVGPNAVLIFEMELLEIEKRGKPATQKPATRDGVKK